MEPAVAVARKFLKTQELKAQGVLFVPARVPNIPAWCFTCSPCAIVSEVYFGRWALQRAASVHARSPEHEEATR